MKLTEIANKYFNCTDRERAVFESGIKLGTVYHQFIGTPISKSNVRDIEKAIEAGTRVQPFVKDVKVRIDRKKLRDKKSEYDYQTLSNNMLTVYLKVKYKNTVVIAELKYIEKLKYPLMYIKEIKTL
jgi:hypothetical protein